MQLINWLASAGLALALTALLTRAPRPGVTRRRENPNRLLRDIALLFGIALFFPVWDYGLIDALGLPLIRLWTPRLDITAGAVVLLVLPPLIEVLRRGRSPGLGWRLPVNGWVVVMGALGGALLGVLPVLLGLPVAPLTLFDTLLSLVTVVLLEENLFRGSIQGRLEQIFAGHWPWLLSGLLYGLWVLPVLLAGAGQAEGPAWAGPLAWWLSWVSLGWLLAIMRDRTGSVLPGLVAHALVLYTGAWLALLLGR